MIIFGFLLLLFYQLVDSSSTSGTFYDILDIQPDCTEEDLLNQFLHLAIKNHPDNHDGRNTRRFYSICDAYDYLKDTSRRKEYNSQLNFPTSFDRKMNISQIGGYDYDMTIGIDFGTTHSSVAYYDKEQEQPVVIQNEHGNKVTESVVGFIPGGMILVGDGVWDQCNDIPERVIYDVKRFVGKTHEVVDNEGLRTTFKYRNRGGYPVFVVGGKENKKKKKGYDEELEYTPEYVSSLVIKKMKNIAEANFEEDLVFRAVISVPAYYNSIQRAAIKQSAWLGGVFVVDRLIPEPTAAAYAYGIDYKINKNEPKKKKKKKKKEKKKSKKSKKSKKKKSKKKEDKEEKIIVKEEKILVSFDFGGGTLDLTLLKTNGTHFDVLNTAGHNTLGGEDFTNRLNEYLLEKFSNIYPDLEITNGARYSMRRKAESAKKFMSYGFYRFTQGPYEKDFSVDLKKEEFLELTSDLYDSVEETIAELFIDTEMGKEDVDEVILVGGSSKLPRVKKIVKDFFLPNKVRIKRIPNPDEAVAMGAATVIGFKDGTGGITEIQRYPFAFGIECCKKNEMGTYDCGKYCDIIKKNFKIPIKFKKTFVNVEDYQKYVTVKVFERIGKITEKEKTLFLDEFKLKQITRAPKGETEIFVEFSVLSDGTLHVQAREKKSGVVGEVTIERNRWKDIDVKKTTNLETICDEL